MANRFLSNITINDEYTLPSQDGTADQIISTDGAGTLSFIDPSALAVGESEQVHIACKNTSGVSISKGDPVYITGTVGTSFIIQIAAADASDSAKMPAVGLVETDLDINAEGFVIVSGILKNLTTDPLSSGDGTPSSNDTIYVKAGGGLTKTKPTGSGNYIQNVGKVGRVNSSNAGSIAVSTIMRTNDIPNLSTGKVWVGTPTYTAESGVIHLDESNARLGINNISPTQALDITGNVLSSGSVEGGSIVKTGGTSSQFLKADGSVDSNTYLTSETDPVFTASPASGITSTNITNWDTAYGWGDHSSVGYLTSESDTLSDVTGRGSSTNDSITVGGLHVDSTGAVEMPSGSTLQRPTGVAGMFRFNSEDAQFEGYDGIQWGAIAGSGGGGGGGGEIVKETFSGTGSQATFTLSNTIADIDNISVYVSGVYQYPSNYTVSGTDVTFAAGSIPASGTDNVHVVHTTTVASIAEVGSVFLDQFTGDGTATQFSPLGTSPTSENYTDVYIDGIYQQKNAYSIAGSQITFSSAPDSGAYIEVKTSGTIAPAAVTASATNLVSDSFTATAGQTSFTLTNGTPSAKELTMVFVQGVYQAKANYSLLTGPIRIVLTEGVEVGEEVEVLSVSGANLTTSPVTSVNGQTGAVTVSSGVTSVNGQTGAVTVDSTIGVNVISSDTTAEANNLYVFTANLTLTLPSSPSAGDSIKISNRSETTTCVLGRNGNNIMGSASDLTIDALNAGFELIYSGASEGWIIIGN